MQKQNTKEQVIEDLTTEDVTVTEIAAQETELKAAPASGNEKLERIREIVFGQQSREYAQMFERVHRDVSRLQQEVNTLNDQALAQKRSFQARLDQQVENHATQLQEVQQQFTQRLKKLDNEYRIKQAEVDEKQSQDIQELQRMVHRIQDELYNEMRQTSERLTEDKTDRVSLGELLIELGTNLREGPSNSLMAGLLDELNEDL